MARVTFKTTSGKRISFEASPRRRRAMTPYQRHVAHAVSKAVDAGVAPKTAMKQAAALWHKRHKKK